MPDGGHLTLAISSDPPYTVISIRDTGPGIEPDMLERIFTPFVTTKASGTGLGLAKVYSIMESHDGRIECSSGKTPALHSASTFRAMATSPMRPAMTHNVLVVDDEPSSATCWRRRWVRTASRCSPRAMACTP